MIRCVGENLLMIMSSLRSGSRCRDKAGGLQILDQVAGTERPDWADRVVVVLDLLDRQSGGRFGDLDADARIAVIESLLDDPDHLWVSISAGRV